MSSENKEKLDVTPAAMAHIKKKMAERGSGLGIRIGVKRTGCSGLAYVLEYVDEGKPEDHVSQLSDEVAVFVDAKSFPYVKGTTLDYVKQGLNEGFEFINPNEKARCGCGESFTA